VNVYLLVCTGQGDTDVKLVDQEIWDWINLRETPGRQANASGWIDTATPAKVVEALQLNDNDQNAQPEVTIGSYQNDRVHLVHEPAALFSEYGGSEAIQSAHDFARANGHIIVGTYEGCIY
jgi:hypothetical protein